MEELSLGYMLAVDEGDLDAEVDRQVHGGEERRAFEAFFQPCHPEDVIARIATRAESDEGETPGEGHDAVQVQLLQDLLPRGRLAALRRVGGEALVELLEVLGLYQGR